MDVSLLVLDFQWEFPHTEGSKLSEKVLLVSGAAVVGVNMKSCCTHSSGKLFEATAVLARVFPLVVD